MCVLVPHVLQLDVFLLSHVDEVKRNFILGIIQGCKCREDKKILKKRVKDNQLP